MQHAFIDDPFNPRFVLFAPTGTEDFSDTTGGPHRFAVHVDFAIDAWHRELGLAPEDAAGIRDLAIDVLRPLTDEAAIRVDVWLERLDETSCAFGFLCSSTDGSVAYARGERLIVKVDPHFHRPTPWSLRFRTQQATLLRNLPAYA